MRLADKIVSLEICLDRKAAEADKEWVFTNGCFDLFHPGHLHFLDKAAASGDRLIVAVNTDESVASLKGPNRPFYSLHQRIRTIAALFFVTLVIEFDGQELESIISQIKPNVLVKGSDYNFENIRGADIVVEQGGRVEIIELLESHSTTELMKKIKLS